MILKTFSFHYSTLFSSAFPTRILRAYFLYISYFQNPILPVREMVCQLQTQKYFNIHLFDWYYWDPLFSIVITLGKSVSEVENCFFVSKERGETVLCCFPEAGSLSDWSSLSAYMEYWGVTTSTDSMGIIKMRPQWVHWAELNSRFFFFFFFNLLVQQCEDKLRRQC